MKGKLTHPLGKAVAHNTSKPNPTMKPASKAAAPTSSSDAVLKILKTTTKLARTGGQAATSDVGGPAFTGRY